MTPAPSNWPSNAPSFYPTTIPPSVEPTWGPTSGPTYNPSALPTVTPSLSPTESPTFNPSNNPSHEPSPAPTVAPTFRPSFRPTTSPTGQPTFEPTLEPTDDPSLAPTSAPTYIPTNPPSSPPTYVPTPTDYPSNYPTYAPSFSPSGIPTMVPTSGPTYDPSQAPTLRPSANPSELPTVTPSNIPTREPSATPSEAPTFSPTVSPSGMPSLAPTPEPSSMPTSAPTYIPTNPPSSPPTYVPTPTDYPSNYPTYAPSFSPSGIPTMVPTSGPTYDPSQAPTLRPSANPSELPTVTPSNIPTREPSQAPTLSFDLTPTGQPVFFPTPTGNPTGGPTFVPTVNATTGVVSLAVSSSSYIPKEVVPAVGGLVAGGLTSGITSYVSSAGVIEIGMDVMAVALAGALGTTPVGITALIASGGLALTTGAGALIGYSLGTPIEEGLGTQTENDDGKSVLDPSRRLNWDTAADHDSKSWGTPLQLAWLGGLGGFVLGGVFVTHHAFKKNTAFAELSPYLSLALRDTGTETDEFHGIRGELDALDKNHRQFSKLEKALAVALNKLAVHNGHDLSDKNSALNDAFQAYLERTPAGQTPLRIKVSALRAKAGIDTGIDNRLPTKDIINLAAQGYVEIKLLKSLIVAGNQLEEDSSFGLNKWMKGILEDHSGYYVRYNDNHIILPNPSPELTILTQAVARVAQHNLSEENRLALIAQETILLSPKEKAAFDKIKLTVVDSDSDIETGARKPIVAKKKRTPARVTLKEDKKDSSSEDEKDQKTILLSPQEKAAFDAIMLTVTDSDYSDEEKKPSSTRVRFKKEERDLEQKNSFFAISGKKVLPSEEEKDLESGNSLRTPERTSLAADNYKVSDSSHEDEWFVALSSQTHYPIPISDATIERPGLGESSTPISHHGRELQEERPRKEAMAAQKQLQKEIDDQHRRELEEQQRRDLEIAELKTLEYLGLSNPASRVRLLALQEEAEEIRAVQATRALQENQRKEAEKRAAFIAPRSQSVFNPSLSDIPPPGIKRQDEPRDYRAALLGSGARPSSSRRGPSGEKSVLNDISSLPFPPEVGAATSFGVRQSNQHSYETYARRPAVETRYPYTTSFSNSGNHSLGTRGAIQTGGSSRISKLDWRKTEDVMSKATDLIASSNYTFLDRHSSYSATQERTSSAGSSRTTNGFDYEHAQATIRKDRKAEEFLTRNLEDLRLSNLAGRARLLALQKETEEIRAVQATRALQENQRKEAEKRAAFTAPRSQSVFNPSPNCSPPPAIEQLQRDYPAAMLRNRNTHRGASGEKSVPNYTNGLPFPPSVGAKTSFGVPLSNSYSYGTYSPPPVSHDLDTTNSRYPSLTSSSSGNYRGISSMSAGRKEIYEHTKTSRDDDSPENYHPYSHSTEVRRPWSASRNTSNDPDSKGSFDLQSSLDLIKRNDTLLETERQRQAAKEIQKSEKKKTPERKVSDGTPGKTFSSPRTSTPLTGAKPPSERIPDLTLIDRTLNAGHRFPKEVSHEARDELLNRSRDPNHFLHSGVGSPPRNETQIRRIDREEEAAVKLLDAGKPKSPDDKSHL